MLKIYNSNRLESLAQGLSQSLYDDGLSPLQPRTIVTINQAMSSWLQLQLCKHNGVAANIDYIRPATCIWQIARTILYNVPIEEPLSRENMTWLVYQALPALMSQNSFKQLKGYLTGDTSHVKRWQLSQKISDIFDRYQHYRPQMIRDWEAGKESDWQAQLWLAISSGKRHRVSIIDELVNKLEATDSQTKLPVKIDFFSVHSLPPIFIELLTHLASHIDIRLWMIAPTSHYWGDLQPEKSILRQRLDNPQEASLWETGNSLLASWGKQGQAMQDLFLDQQESSYGSLEDDDLSALPERDSLLHHIQADIYELEGDGRATGKERTVLDQEAASTIGISVAHSALRECQILHDRILDMLAEDQDLRPEDILVMIPEISTYAPYVEAVFTKGDEARPFIPWNISDITIADEHPLTRTFLALLDLPNSRFTRSEILNFLDVPEVCENFSLSVRDPELIREWLADLHTFWGLDGKHKESLGLPDISDNTWEQARQRLFTGYALGDGEMYNGIAPYTGVSGGDAMVLGNFWHLLETLRSSSKALSQSRLSDDWNQSLNDLLNDVFGGYNDDNGKIQRIRDAISDFAQETREVKEELSAEIVRDWFEQTLNSDSVNSRYYSGGVTFSGMRPMRSVPFKVICLMGMHDSAFPRRDRPADFDLMQESWRHGDPRPGYEDRYLFLETLLAARKRLYISYTGRDIKNNDEIQPSVLVRELIDYIDLHYQLESGKLSKSITTEYPLQPFSARNYRDTDRLPRSYDGWWCEVARTVDKHQADDGEKAAWPNFQLEELSEEARTISLTELIRFVKNPVKNFISRRLKVWLEEDEEAEDSEPFVLNALELYNIKGRLLNDRISDDITDIKQFHAEGLLPHGSLGAITIAAQQDDIDIVYAQLKGLLTGTPEQVRIDLPLTDSGNRQWHITGKLQDVIPGSGLLRYRPAKLKGKDILSIWIEHLALVAMADKQDVFTSHHLASDKHYMLSTAFTREQAKTHLSQLLDIYWQGLHQPLPVLENASFEWAKIFFKNSEKDMEVAITAADKAAKKKWSGDPRYGSFDENRTEVQLMCRGTEGNPLALEQFRQLASSLYQPALQHGEGWQ